MKNASIRAFIGIGSNIGAREEFIQSAVDRLKATPGLEPTRASSVYETEPWGKQDQGAFLNAVLECATTLAPAALHAALKAIEDAIGREQAERYGPRRIDLDILLYGSDEVEEEHLNVPHPRMHLRRFVLVPLAEIAPDARHPKLGTTIAGLLATCADIGRVWKHGWNIAGVQRAGNERPG